MDRNTQLRGWGKNLKGLAQGGLLYGVRDEPDVARYNRMMEIAQELLDKTDDIDDDLAEGVARKLQEKDGGLTEEQAMDQARELLGKSDGISDEQVRSWGDELVKMADIGLVEGHESLFDINRYQSIREMGGNMQEI